MLKFVYYFFARFPYLEVIARVLYWKSAWMHSLLSALFKRKKSVAKKGTFSSSPGVSLELLEKELTDHGIGLGDILIVHSSMRSLVCTGSTPSQIIGMLIRVVGPTGTLVMPAIPKYDENVTGLDRINADLSDLVLLYDVQKTPPWTGILPHTLMKIPKSRRGKHPLNTVVAYGAHVDDIFCGELLENYSTPCGPNSAWAYCAGKNAKIIALGVDLAHSLTMIHVAEDSYENDWPIPGWYRYRKFIVRDNGFEEVVNVRERHPKWAMFYAERKLDYDLSRNNISKKSYVGPIAVTSLESARLLEFLNKRKTSGYPFYLWSVGLWL